MKNIFIRLPIHIQHKIINYNRADMYYKNHCKTLHQIICKRYTICHTLQDTEGPYDSNKICTQRAYQIASELPSYLPMYIAEQYMCMEQPKGTRI